MTGLPFPLLEKQEKDRICVITDNALAEAIGVRVAFSGRSGGFSQAPYDELNLGSHVGDDGEAVLANRAKLLRVLGAEGCSLVVPNQVHGTNLVFIESCDSACVEHARMQAQAGADGLLVEASRVVALLCYADCVPVVIVSSTGLFAVVHAGWRGVEAGIASRAAREMALRGVASGSFGSAEAALTEMNVYFGPHIHGECFETGPDVHARFVERFGSSCVVDATHINLAAALRDDLLREGIDGARIVDAGICTVCSCEDYYSYRASGGVCGRHGALAFREEVVEWE